MSKQKYLKVIHPTPADKAQADEFLKLASMREPMIGPIFAELVELIEKYPENELFYWKMATYAVFGFFKQADQQLLKFSTGQVNKNPTAPMPTQIYATTTMPPRAR